MASYLRFGASCAAFAYATDVCTGSNWMYNGMKKKLSVCHVHDPDYEEHIDESTKRMVSEMIKRYEDKFWDKKKIDWLSMPFVSGSCFVSNGVDFCHLGCTQINNGQFIMVPYFTRCKDTSDINTESIALDKDPQRQCMTGYQYSWLPHVVSSRVSSFLQGHPTSALKPRFSYDNLSCVNSPVSIDWNSEAGQSILNSFILSDNAKRFCIARECGYLDTWHVHVDSFFRASGFAVGLVLTQFPKKMTRKGYFDKRVHLLKSLFSLCFGVAFLGYVKALDFYHVRRDFIADYNAAQLGLDLIDGGIEVYSKLLQRNIATREILGEDGFKIFEPNGDYKYRLLRKHNQSLSVRLQMLQKYKSEKRVQEKLG